METTVRNDAKQWAKNLNSIKDHEEMLRKLLPRWLAAHAADVLCDWFKHSELNFSFLHKNRYAGFYPVDGGKAITVYCMVEDKDNFGRMSFKKFEKTFIVSELLLGNIVSH